MNIKNPPSVKEVYRKKIIAFIVIAFFAFLFTNCGSSSKKIGDGSIDDNGNTNNNGTDGIPTANDNDFIPIIKKLGPVPAGQFAGEQLVIEIAGVNFKFRWIPAGSFNMGAAGSDNLQFYETVGTTSTPLEQPLHLVNITEGFWLQENEITNKEYKALMGTAPSQTAPDALPVINITYQMVSGQNGFLDKIHTSTITSNKFGLPTEAQWEYACRAGTTTRFYWGDSNLDSDATKYCWYAFNSGNQLQETGLKIANAWGLKDMSGNAYELVSDLAGFYPDTSQTDPKGPTTGNAHIFRGGSFKSNTANCRSTNRILKHIDLPYDNQSFRITLKPD